MLKKHLTPLLIWRAANVIIVILDDHQKMTLAISAHKSARITWPLLLGATAERCFCLASAVGGHPPQRRDRIEISRNIFWRQHILGWQLFLGVPQVGKISTFLCLFEMGTSLSVIVFYAQPKARVSQTSLLNGKLLWSINATESISNSSCKLKQSRNLNQFKPQIRRLCLFSLYFPPFRLIDYKPNILTAKYV